MSARRLEALQALAERGATPGEAAAAAHALRAHLLRQAEPESRTPPSPATPPPPRTRAELLAAIRRVRPHTARRLAVDVQGMGRDARDYLRAKLAQIEAGEYRPPSWASDEELADYA